jgi:hypothetical protein
MGKEPHDWDITTSALPEETLKAFAPGDNVWDFHDIDVDDIIDDREDSLSDIGVDPEKISIVVEEDKDSAKELDEDEIKVNTLIGIVQSALNNQLGLANSNVELYTQEEVGIYDDPFEYYSINFCGGLNGLGMWSSYFETLSGMMAELEEIFEDAWVIALDVDCSDDIFYLTLGIKPYENQLS